MNWRIRSRVSLWQQKGGIKEQLQNRGASRGNTKIWVIEDPEGEEKVNERENI